MKRYFAALLMLAAMVSCGKQDDVYKEFIVEGGRVYPAKVRDLESVSGFQRVILEWTKPFDPSLKTAKVFWDNYSKSMDLNYADFPDGNVSVVISDLEDRSYTFDVVNYDAKGNQSLAEEISVTPFGTNWLISHTERSVVSSRMDGTDAKIVMTKSTKDMVATKFRYQTADGRTVESDYLLPEDVEFTLPEALKGKRFDFKSAYLPSSGIDTVWAANWSHSPDAIVYPLPTDGWTVGVTEGQEFGTYTCDLILDGVIAAANRWQSSHAAANQRTFPKILTIDTKMEKGQEYTFSDFVLYQNPANVTNLRYLREFSIFVGDEPFDPNDLEAMQHFGTPAITAAGNRSEDRCSVVLSSSVTGRYIAIVFTNSYSTSGWLDLWELVPYGFWGPDAD